MTTLFAELADIQPKRRGRKKLPYCPVCKTPRDLKQLFTEAVCLNATELSRENVQTVSFGGGRDELLHHAATAKSDSGYRT